MLRFFTVLVMLAVLGPEAVALGQKGEARAMKLGPWEGEYTDIDGHRARMVFNIASTGAAIRGTFEMVLSTEDKAERYKGTLTGTAHGESISLKLQLTRGTVLTCDLQLREPAAYAEQAVFGTVEPARALNFGGGTLVAWNFRRP